MLIDAGFSVEGHLPLMTCALGAERILPVPEGSELILPITDADLFATVAVGHEALDWYEKHLLREFLSLSITDADLFATVAVGHEALDWYEKHLLREFLSLS